MSSLPTPLELLKQKHADLFKGLQFSSKDNKMAGKVLKKDGEEAALAFLSERGVSRGELPNFRPPAKTLVVAQSRPFEEFPIYRVSEAIQLYVYSLSVKELETVPSGSSTKKEHQRFFQDSSVPDFGYTSVQGLNKIFGLARGIYLGVITRGENQLQKAKSKHEALNKKRRASGEAETEFDPTPYEYMTPERKLAKPPGVNHSIMCYVDISVDEFDFRNPDGIVLPSEYAGYCREINTAIEKGTVDRLGHLKGGPGYIPGHQRKESTTEGPKINFRKGRIRRSYTALYAKRDSRRVRQGKLALPSYRHHMMRLNSNAESAILAVIFFGKDWVVFDLRGLLRNVRWRNLFVDGSTPSTLLGMFGDPVIDPKRGVVAFCYKEQIVPVVSKSITKMVKAPELLNKLYLKSEDPLVLVAIDLGQTNPVGVGVYRVMNASLDYEVVTRFALESELLREIESYRQRTNAFEAQIRAETFDAMTSEEQEEITRVRAFSASKAKENVCHRFGMPVDAVDWATMGSNTIHIAKWVMRHGDPSLVEVLEYRKDNEIKLDKNGVPKKVKLTDKRIANLTSIRLRFSQETSKHYNDTMWELRRKHPVYQKLSKSKADFSRRVVNSIIRRVNHLVPRARIVFIIEDLKNLGKVFHGSGKRELGWDSYFEPKSENRWFIQVLHKAFSETGKHKGYYIIECWPNWTSCTCPKCSCCDSENRHGEVFRCLACGYTCNTDFGTAPDNLVKIATTGKGLPGPKKRCKGSSKGKNPKIARSSETGVSVTESGAPKVKKSSPTQTSQSSSQSAP